MYKAGDKVIFRRYDDIAEWKDGIFEIGEIMLDRDLVYKYSVKQKRRLLNGDFVYVYSSTFHTFDELITIKECRRLKLEKISGMCDGLQSCWG